MILDEDSYISHYGVKGMKWGVRKTLRERKQKREAHLATLTPRQRNAEIRNRKRKNAQRVRNAVGLAVTAAWVSTIMSSPSGGSSVRSISRAVEDVDEVAEESHTIAKNAREILRAQERQRNGAYQVRQMLKNMGEDVV